ncbi:hypothetical protein Ctha_1010 [Chloroherpeton thalassium ATCC 35110]|uniref:Uncharacterized protein n=1 Tax=Chloroherpeton thalassium (strain ATCC 35110 / GB-78) TaxID=517418 RepID=B3QXU7_CHLT3|nr:hypothetical protein Ctha_1010 [Chloroherpeton thalassium ATCC 35110]
MPKQKAPNEIVFLHEVIASKKRGKDIQKNMKTAAKIFLIYKLVKSELY